MIEFQRKANRSLCLCLTQGDGDARFVALWLAYILFTIA